MFSCLSREASEKIHPVSQTLRFLLLRLLTDFSCILDRCGLCEMLWATAQEQEGGFASLCVWEKKDWGRWCCWICEEEKCKMGLEKSLGIWELRHLTIKPFMLYSLKMKFSPDPGFLYFLKNENTCNVFAGKNWTWDFMHATQELCQLPCIPSP